MEFIITVGCSASGKSTLAALLSRKYIDVNRDKIRFTYIMPEAKWDWSKYNFTKENEDRVSKIENTMLESAAVAGHNVIISNTNLSKKVRTRWVKKAKDLGYNVEVVVLDIPLETLLERDRLREAKVGKDVIEGQWERFRSMLPSLQVEADELGYKLRIIK